MLRSATQYTQTSIFARPLPWLAEVAIIVGASLFVAASAHLSVPLPFTPVPLTTQNFAVILVGLLLGSRRGAAALALYLAEGAAGLPVFALGSAGLVHFTGPTAGFLIAYPAVAFLSGWIAERGLRSFTRCAIAAIAAETLLFAAGVSWLAVLTHNAALAASYGAYPFLFAEIIKVLLAAGIASRVPAKQAE